jgi:probable rRNA maturation factor
MPHVIFLADEQTEQVGHSDLHSLAELVLREEGFPEDAEVTLLLVSESEMAGYNQRFLDRDGPTDVLAFPVEELSPGFVPDADPHGPPLVLGDVIVSPSYVRRQAVDFEVAFEDEMALMVTHGILHLLGYDHIDDAEAERMESRERDLLSKVGRTRR